ncbi:MAG: thiamine pyrophosphate-dependent dehydrogenase E1 component subunit alpha [Candidatus Micrarchaeia archaeon]
MDKILKKFYIIRYFEEKVAELHKDGIVKGTDHFSTGQEAIPLGVCSNLMKGDIVTCGHRVYHIALSCGLEPKKIFAELLGKTIGYNKGYAGAMHLSSKKDGFWGANGIVSANVAISSGIALGLKMQKTNSIVVTFLGDGATTQGIFHETLNMASLWDLPILFVCENNYWAQSTSIKEHSAVIDLAKKVKQAYGIESFRVDGTDINIVMKSSKIAIDKVRKGKPVFIEFLTYRQCGHSINDVDKSYFTKEYIRKAKLHDPIIKYERYLLKKKLITKEKIEDLKKEIKEQLEKDLIEAKNARDTEFNETEVFR